MSDHYTRRPSGFLVPAEHVIRPAQACNMLGMGAMMMGASTAVNNNAPAWAPASDAMEFVIDAGASGSYSGSGTTWSNTITAPASGASQSAYNFTTSGLTFAGTPGAGTSSEYFSSAGSGYAQIGANTTFTDSWPHDNTAFTFLEVVYRSSSSTAHTAFAQSTNGGSGSVSAELAYVGTYKPEFYVNKGSLPLAIDVLGDTAQPTGWVVNAISLSEGGSSFFYTNGGYVQVSAADTFTATYSSPSASSATTPLTIFGWSSAGASSGARIALVAAWNRALTKAELDTAWTNLRSRWSL